jgi:hypothetical protein
MAVANSLNSGPATNALTACALLAAAAVTRRLRNRRLRACAIAARTLLIIVNDFVDSFALLNKLHSCAFLSAHLQQPSQKLNHTEHTLFCT